MARTKDAVEILKRRMGTDPQSDLELRRISDDFHIAQMIYDARTAAQLTQQQLAERIGTSQSVISQLESADYKGHSLSMLRRIASALELQLRVEFIPLEANSK